MRGWVGGQRPPTATSRMDGRSVDSRRRTR